MAKGLDLKIKGLYLNPNNLSEVPPGALMVADNIVVDKDSVAESRRGQDFYGDTLTGTIGSMFNYKDTIIVQHDGTLSYDSDGAGTWVAYSGTYNPHGELERMKSTQANRNMYFATEEGVYKLDSVTGVPVLAGVVKGLDGSGTTTGASGFMSHNTNVAYRIVWGYTDANGNVILGAPSQRIIVTNSSGGTRDINLTFTIPSSITTSYFYQVYRSPMSIDLATDPSDELALVYEDSPSSAEITAKEVTITDNTPEDLRGAALYTNASQEGIENANDEPPLSVDLTTFKNHTFYFNTETKQTKLITLVAVDGTDGIRYITRTGDTHTNTTIDDLSSTSDLKVGMRVIGSGIPSNTTIVSIDSSTSITISNAATTSLNNTSLEFQDWIAIGSDIFYGGSSESVSTNQFLVTTAGTAAEDIEDTAISLVKVMNKASGNTDFYAYYLSGFDDLPGQIQIQARTLGSAALALTSSRGSAFNPELPSSGSTVTTDNEVRPNRVYISKENQPEAVPALSYIDIGSRDADILRGIALRDGVFVFKEDGIYRISGETRANFRVSPFDNTALLVGPDTAISFNNQIYCHSDQGVVAVSDNGVQIIGRPIENELNEISEFTNFTTLAHAVGYESDRKYILYVPTDDEDTYATQAFAYNALTNVWTRWTTPRTSAFVNPTDNKLYTGHPTNGYVYKENKTFTRFDHADESYAVTISSASGAVITLASVTNVAVGMSIKQGSSVGLILSIDGNDITIDVSDLTWTAGSARVYTPIAVSLQFAPIHMGDPSMVKHFSESTMFFRDAVFRELTVNYSTNFSGGSYSVVITPQSLGTWGEFQWGDIPWGGQPGGKQAIRTYINRQASRANWLNIKLMLEQAFTNMGFEGLSVKFNPMSERFK